MEHINSKQTGRGTFSPLQNMVALSIVAVWAIVVATAYFTLADIWVVVLVMFVSGIAVGGGILKYVLDKVVFNRIITNIAYRIRKRRGKAGISTYVLPIEKLKKHIPMKKVHDGGLIQYTKNDYGVVFRYDPRDISKAEYEHYIKQVNRFVNSFGEDMEISFHVYDMLDRETPLKDQLLEQFNRDGGSLAQKRHLQDMYDKIEKRSTDRVLCKFLLAIRLGTFNTLEHAQKAYNSQIPGMLRSMREIGAPTMQMINENEVALAFREFATMEEV